MSIQNNENFLTILKDNNVLYIINLDMTKVSFLLNDEFYIADIDKNILYLDDESFSIPEFKTWINEQINNKDSIIKQLDRCIKSH